MGWNCSGLLFVLVDSTVVHTSIPIPAVEVQDRKNYMEQQPLNSIQQITNRLQDLMQKHATDPIYDQFLAYLGGRGESDLSILRNRKRYLRRILPNRIASQYLTSLRYHSTPKVQMLSSICITNAGQGKQPIAHRFSKSEQNIVMPPMATHLAPTSAQTQAQRVAQCSLRSDPWEIHII